jgi:5'-methylthioadenosine phosphorylase
MSESAEIGIIGGSGLYDMDGLSDAREVDVDTPFGKPSDAIRIGTLEGRRVAFLARHARGHRILPSELNFRANIFAMKKLGVEWVISVSAVGSLKNEYSPMHMLVPDQLVDRTHQRVSTFFGRGLVAHVALAHPFSTPLRKILKEACDEAGATCHEGGTYICIEGPLFSTQAESELYRSWGMDVVGMTAMQEARLAREAELSYATLAMITDYDCWHPEHDSVTADQIIATLVRNAATAQAVLKAALRRVPPAGDPARRQCESWEALKTSLVTASEIVPEQVKRDLEPLIGRYMK